MATSDKLSLSERLSRKLASLDIKPKNILDFAKDELGIDLLPAQIFIFKLFYSIPLSDSLADNKIEIGDRFNENILYTFTEVEFLKYLYETKRINIDHIDPDQIFTEIVFVIGRRGTKTTMSSIITLYTIYLILLLPNPHQYFGILEQDEIGVAIVSNSRDGADRQFRSISKMVFGSPFFKKHLVKDPSGGQLFLKSNRLLSTTDEDLISLTKNKGDILISTFAANPNVRGASNIVTIGDEFAHFLDSDVSSKKNPLDKLVFEALTPSTSGFVNKDGSPAGKNFFISSPNGEKGLLYEIYKSAMANRGDTKTSTLVINVPSHWVNRKLNSKTLRAFYSKSERSFEQEYEAKFIKGSGQWLLNIQDRVYGCINKINTNQMEAPNPLAKYFLGIDFGVSGDGTALAVAHYEPMRSNLLYEYIDGSWKIESEVQNIVVVDYIEYLFPEPGTVVSLDDIMDSINKVVKFYNIDKGTYDQYAGEIFTQLLHKEGHKNLDKEPATQQTNSDQAKTFRQLINEHRLVLPNKPDFTDELFRLNETVSREGLIRVADDEFHDDQFDAVCRAVWLVYSDKDSNINSNRAHSLSRSKRIRNISNPNATNVITKSGAVQRSRPRSNPMNVRRPGQVLSGRK